MVQGKSADFTRYQNNWLKRRKTQDEKTSYEAEVEKNQIIKSNQRRIQIQCCGCLWSLVFWLIRNWSGEHTHVFSSFIVIGFSSCRFVFPFSSFFSCPNFNVLSFSQFPIRLYATHWTLEWNNKIRRIGCFFFGLIIVVVFGAYISTIWVAIVSFVFL